ncbi:hydrolase [Marinomonas sp. M1K-6]|uniref:Hydrolase n=1 Tax=Marinomonas profundi TaxID=2726122 RepID=A0A847R395_9GAMM|nr:alpha/beta family hydrolase [Marinomonas profundi]NLQ16406.1 hydrolase [Marinomonas profundi]UDV03021.1 dienelactone hydrolase family protein [Marinomonas profundi]
MTSLAFYLAHGAGAGHNNDFLTQLAAAISRQRQQAVIPVTFSYMQEQERSAKKRPPPKFDTLIPEYRHYVEHEEACIVAGKSMGGRVATQLSHLPMVKAIVCFGFPFYPAGKPEKNRLSFLADLQVPCLIIQGTRDSLGNQDWVNQQTLPENIDIIWVDGADHDFKVLKKYNKNLADTINEVAIATQHWLVNNIQRREIP